MQKPKACLYNNLTQRQKNYIDAYKRLTETFKIENFKGLEHACDGNHNVDLLTDQLTADIKIFEQEYEKAKNAKMEDIDLCLSLIDIYKGYVSKIIGVDTSEDSKEERIHFLSDIASEKVKETPDIFGFADKLKTEIDILIKSLFGEIMC